MNQKTKKKDPGIYICPAGSYYVPDLCDRSLYTGFSYVFYKMGWHES